MPGSPAAFCHFLIDTSVEPMRTPKGVKELGLWEINLLAKGIKADNAGYSYNSAYIPSSVL